MPLNCLFAYGSLAFPEVLKHFRNREHKLIDAKIKGYKLMTIKRDIFPTLIQSEDDEVNGKIILGLDEEFLDDLDDYEGGDYERIQEKAYVSNGVIECFLYVNRIHQIDDLMEGWSPTDFRKHHLGDLLESFIQKEEKLDHI